MGEQNRESFSDAEIDQQIKAVEREHLCRCEVCSRTSAVCPASASTLILEVAGRRLDVLRKQQVIAALEAENAELRAKAEAYDFQAECQHDPPCVRCSECLLLAARTENAELREENARLLQENGTNRLRFEALREALEAAKEHPEQAVEIVTQHTRVLSRALASAEKGGE